VSASQTSPADDWETVRTIATRHYMEGIDILASIATLERGNDPTVVAEVKTAKAGDAALLIQKALFGRVHLATMRCFDPERNGDEHLAVAVRLLKKPDVLAVASSYGRPYLGQLISEFDRLSADPRLNELRHYRNKFVAHLSKPNPSTNLPQIKHLLGFAEETAHMMELLAFGTEVVLIKLDVQVEAYRESADAFWGRWM
jgi:hypothetical protein